ncbi:cell death abnormality protein 1-like [Ruditapes philippinarum]|uniref:cell death abnormality protein 1-like n=1 Tax=Ruditapes philippinarum TaxID=129788 RepID=UPI00295ABEE8|nr:cell death abnormality protein 1-like [Ruditapes philippinarum]
MSLRPALMISFLLLGISILYGETTDLGASCTPPVNNAADECTVKDSECKTNTCACKTGFIKENGACPKALGKACVNNNECVSNSKCAGTIGSKTCSCIDGFGNKDGLCSKTVDGIDCSSVSTACDTIQNAACDATSKKCKCNTGFIMNVDKCDPKNSAALINFGVVTMVMSLLTAFIL